MPPKHKELSGATLKKIMDGAEEAATKAAESGSAKQALLLFRGYASAYAKWKGGLDSWYKAVKKKEKKLVEKLEKYRESWSLGSGNETVAKETWNAFVEYDNKLDEKAFATNFIFTIGEIFKNNYYSATGEYPTYGEKLEW